MSVEQRIRAYYARHSQGNRDGYYSDNRSANIYMDLAIKFKMPIRKIREILGKRPPKPPYPGLPESCIHEEDGYCFGRVTWHWNRENQKWESRCSTHYPGWARWTNHARWAEITEERIKRGLQESPSHPWR